MSQVAGSHHARYSHLNAQNMSAGNFITSLVSDQDLKSCTPAELQDNTSSWRNLSKSFPRVLSLSLRVAVSQQDLRNILQLPLLRALHIDWSADCGWAPNGQQLPVHSMKQLTALSFPPTEADWDKLSELTNLCRLHITRDGHPHSYSLLSKLSSLTYLHAGPDAEDLCVLTTLCSLTLDQLNATKQRQMTVTQLTSVTCLSVSMYDYVSAVGNRSCLHSLYVKLGADLEDGNQVQDLSCLSHLRLLDVKVPGIGDAGMKGIAALTRLTHLTLSFGQFESTINNSQMLLPLIVLTKLDHLQVTIETCKSHEQNIASFMQVMKARAQHMSCCEAVVNDRWTV